MSIRSYVARALIAASRKTRPTSALMAVCRLLRPESHLRRYGWFETVRQERPVDADGRELPWFTYSAIAFLAPRIDRGQMVFEYGSGNSTLWWSRLAGRVVSCEHDRGWFRDLAPRLPDNVEYLFRPLADGDYARAILDVSGDFDVVVIDGRERVRCAQHALSALKESGVVVWDNSDRDDYREGYEALTAAGFKRLDFEGPGPVNTYAWCTSVFYRPGNCLGI